MKNRIGIVGGGQLGKMLAIEAKRLGFIVNIIDPIPHSPAGQVSDCQIVASYKDERAIKKLVAISDYLTFEIELANSAILDQLSERRIIINPSAKTLDIIKDKLRQKQFLKQAGIPTASFHENINHFDYPYLLKARFDAYDGRGNALIKKRTDITAGLSKLNGRPLYSEKYIPFVKELAIIVARSIKGEIVTYPLVETIHKNNICHLVIAPAPVDKKIHSEAKKLAITVMQHLKGAGAFGIEMFLTKDNRMLVNEIAPRVHNSGHYTIEACITNQFTQHIRAITGLPLGSPKMIVPAAVMINILGERDGRADVGGLEKVLSLTNVCVHIYGKHETRHERKMGHITVIDESITKALTKAKKARKYILI